MKGSTNAVLKFFGLALVSILCAGDAVSTVRAQMEASFSLAELGSYAVGSMTVTFVDEARDARQVAVRLLYPAAASPEGSTPAIRRDAKPDRSGAPYPLILTGYNTGGLFVQHMPSHGFVMAVVTDSLPVYHYDGHLVDYPRDLVFVLGQLAYNPPDPLIGLIDTDHAGVMGYSWDGYGALAVSGARADPEYYLAACASASLKESGYPDWWHEYACLLADDWGTFVTNAGPALTTSADGLWQPITDERIRAVAPMGPEGALYFGPQGLAATDRPALIISGTADDMNPYAPEAVYIYEHLGTSDRILISFVGAGHMTLICGQTLKQMKHFATAFFGYHLQGHQEYADLFSQAFVEQFDDLAWGVYTGE